MEDKYVWYRNFPWNKLSRADEIWGTLNKSTWDHGRVGCLYVRCFQTVLSFNHEQTWARRPIRITSLSDVSGHINWVPHESAYRRTWRMDPGHRSAYAVLRTSVTQKCPSHWLLATDKPKWRVSLNLVSECLLHFLWMIFFSQFRLLCLRIWSYNNCSWEFGWDHCLNIGFYFLLVLMCFIYVCMVRCKPHNAVLAPWPLLSHVDSIFNKSVP